MRQASPELWRRASSLFEEALGHPTTLRTAFARRACGQDRELYAALSSLLDADREAGPVDEALPRAQQDARSADFRIGRYRILRCIGRGGMGTVYLGELSEQEIERRVAIKLIDEAQTPQVLDLFRRERQILARMNHPYVARFLDVGATRDGRPYVVMEYVEGFPLVEHCDFLRLGVRRRIKLFLKVCAAVGHAHRNLVVHRDLKPSNVLVTDAGDPKLLDFGIAKLLDLPGVDSTQATARTKFLTPDYASPEQLMAQPVSTGSDIYSLGVLLYQLLTGCLPRQVRSLPDVAAFLKLEPRAASDTALAGGVAQATRHDQTPAARAAMRDTTPARLRRQLAGDLDVILARCLRIEPRERYSSVERLEEDLQRHLRGLPVRARPPSLLYRASRFARRHAAVLAALSVALLALAGFVISTVTHSRRLELERDLAHRAQQDAEQITRYLTDAFQLADAYRSVELGQATGNQALGPQMTMADFLDYWAERIGQDLDSQPLLQARLLHTLGRVYNNLGSRERAFPLLRQALNIRRRSLGPAHLEVAESLNGLGAALLGAGHLEETERTLREALKISRPQASGGRELAESLELLGLLLMEKNDYAAAESVLREALEARSRLEGQSTHQLATVWMNLGAALWLSRDLHAAESALRQALTMLQPVADPGHPDIATAQSYLGSVLTGRGKYQEAEQLYRESLAMRRRFLGAEHPETLVSLAMLGDFLNYKGDYAAAEKVVEEALAIDRRIKGEEHPDTIKDLHSLALIHWQQGDLALAESLLRESLKRAHALWSDENRATLSYMHLLGELLHEKGDLSVAEDHLRRVLELRSRHLGQDDRSTGMSAAALASLLASQGSFEEALPLAEHAVRTIRAVDSEGHWRPAVAESILGECLAGVGRIAEAEDLLAGSLTAIEAGRGSASRHARAATRRLSRFYRSLGRHEEAHRLLNHQESPP